MSSVTLTGSLLPCDFLSPGGASTSGIYVVGEIPAGTQDGVNTSFTLANAPSSLDELGLYLSGGRLERVLAAPNSMQFVILGTTITMGLAPRATDSLFADYVHDAINLGPVIGETPTGLKNGVNTVYTLASTPLAASSVGVFLSGVRLELVGAAPNGMQFTLSGTTLTLGLAPRATDGFFADYLT